MESEFLKFYNSLILQKQQNKSEKQSIENITNSQQGINQIFQIASQDYPNITLEDVKSAGKEVNQAYKKSPALFDQLPKKEETQHQSKLKKSKSLDTNHQKKKTTEPEKSSTAFIKDKTSKKADTDSTIAPSNNNKSVKQSIDISSSQFTAYYNELFGIKTPEIIQEAQQQDVEDGNYMLVVDDNGSFHIVNTEDEDQQTKFTAEDYKKIDEWVKQNFKIWKKYVRQYGGTSLVFNDNLINEVTEKTGIKNKQRVKQIITKIKQLTQFKQFKAYFKNAKQKNGDMDKQEEEDFQKRYLYAVCLFIEKCIKDGAIDAASVAKIKADKKAAADKKATDQADRKQMEQWKAACQKFADDHEEAYIHLGNACDHKGKYVDDADDIKFKAYDFRNYKMQVAEHFTQTDQIDSKQQRQMVTEFLQGARLEGSIEGPLHPMAVADFVSKWCATDTDGENHNYKNKANAIINDVKDFMHKNDPNNKYMWMNVDNIPLW